MRTDSRETAEILKDFSHLIHCPFYLFRDGTPVFPSEQEISSLRMEQAFLTDPGMLEWLQAPAQDGVPLFAVREDPAFAGIFYGCLEAGEDFVILGPFTETARSADRIRAYLQHYRLRDFGSFDIPRLRLDEARACLALLHHALLGVRAVPAFLPAVSPSPAGAGEITEYTVNDYRLMQNENRLRHAPYRMEQRFMDAIARGDETVLTSARFSHSRSIDDGTLGITAHSPEKQEEYLCVVGVSLMARAAISGGMNPYDAYDLNDLFLQRISEVSRAEDYAPIVAQATQRFLREVRKAQAESSPSLPVRKCKEFVSQHLYQPFTLADAAASAGVSPAYLSGLFRETEHMTLKEYTLRERVKAGKNLLLFSDCTISQIADCLCFSSQSHFGAVFRRITGETPGAAP